VYEAGFSGFRLHRELSTFGITNMVVHAASVEIAARERVKTDKRDSLKLAIQLDCGRLKGIRVPSETEEARRILHRTREQLIRKRSATMNRIRMRLYQFGIRVSKERLSRRWVAEYLEGPRALRPEVVRGIQSLLRIWEALDKEIYLLNRELREQAKEDLLEATYRSVPGIGPISARILSTELGDMRQFSNERALFCFTGLTPGEHSSGERLRRGHISRQGSGRLRAVLVECAWAAVRKDPALKARFLALTPRLGKRRAIVAIARKLIGIVRSLFRKQQLYQPQVQLAA
jgi:transposase